MNQRWFIALVFMVLYKPAMFSQMPALHTFDTISNVFKVMVIAVLGVWFVYFYQKVSLFFVGIVFFEVWRVLATIYCGGNYTSLFIAILNALAICLVVEMGLKTDPDALLDGASFTLGLFVLINFALYFCFRKVCTSLTHLRKTTFSDTETTQLCCFSLRLSSQ